MSSFPVLSVITWAPFVGAILIMFLARRSAALVRGLAVLSTSVSLVLSIAVYVAYDREAAGFQFYEDFPLVPALGINYQLGVDGMSLLMILLTSIIIFAGTWASWTVKVRSQEFYALLLILVTGVYGVFVSLDLFVLFLFYEIAVLPMYLLIGIWGSSGEVRPQGVFGWAFGRTGVGTKEYAAMKLTLYLLFGSAFILVGILALYVAGDSSSFSFLEMELTQFDPKLQSWVFLAFYVGFGILAGIWPLHTWSPDGHASAPTAVSHMGVVMLGAATLTEVGLNGSVYQMFAHGIMTGLFFALVGLVYEKAHSREIFKMGGFARSMPGIATAFTIAGLSSLGLPATAGFVAEFLTFLGAWQSSHAWWLFPAVGGAYLTAIYVLRVTKQIFWGPPSTDPHFQNLPDARGPEWAALWILVAVIVLFGIWPSLALGPVDTATMPLLNRLWVLQ